MSSSYIYNDAVPDPNNISVGTQVLFKQGYYTDARNQIAYRWHEGVVTQVQTFPGAFKTFTGHHTKTNNDKKLFNYPERSYFFENYPYNDLRLCFSSIINNDDHNSRLTVMREKEPIDLGRKPRLNVGDRVIAEYKRLGRFFSATIQQFRADSIFIVRWDNKRLQQNQKSKHLFYNLITSPIILFKIIQPKFEMLFFFYSLKNVYPGQPLQF